MNVDEENTVRKLRGETLFVTRQWLCRFGIHTWLQWGDPIKTKYGIYDFVEQHRRCGSCGLFKRKKVQKD